MSARTAGRRPARGQRPGTQDGALAPGVVKVRLLGADEDIDAVARLLGAVVIERSRPYENRDQPGVRVYLTLQIPGSNSPQREQR